MNILIFKTNLDTPDIVNKAKIILSPVNGIKQMNVDLNDIDNVLRIEAETNLSPRAVENVLQRAGYLCEELVD